MNPNKETEMNDDNEMLRTKEPRTWNEEVNMKCAANVRQALATYCDKNGAATDLQDFLEQMMYFAAEEEVDFAAAAARARETFEFVMEQHQQELATGEPVKWRAVNTTNQGEDHV